MARTCLACSVPAIDHWHPRAAPAIYAHFAAQGRGLPPHVRIVGSWTDPSPTTCWQVTEGATADDLAAWREHWSEFMNIEIIPVITEPRRNNSLRIPERRTAGPAASREPLRN